MSGYQGRDRRPALDHFPRGEELLRSKSGIVRRYKKVRNGENGEPERSKFHSDVKLETTIGK